MNNDPVNTDLIETNLEIMGMKFQFKCSVSEVELLKQAASYFEDKMKEIRETTRVLNSDRIAVIAGLNITHQFLNLESKNSTYGKKFQQRLQELQRRVENALVKNSQMELSPAE